MSILEQKMDDQIEGSLHHQKDMNLNQPLTHNGAIWSYQEKEFPDYKTQIEIVRERMERDSGTYEDINEEEIQDFFDDYSYISLKNWPGPWRWIGLLAVAVALFLITYFHHN